MIDWISPTGGPRGMRHGSGGDASMRDAGGTIGMVVSMAYREVLPDLPDDMLRLLAKLR